MKGFDYKTQTDDSSGEYTESTGMIVEDDDTAQDLPQDYAESPVPIESHPRQDENWQAPEDVRPSHGSIPPVGSVVEVPSYRTHPQQDRDRVPSPPPQDIVQPLELLTQMSLTNRASTSSSLDNIISRTSIPIDPALTSLPAEAQKGQNKIGKAERPEESSASNTSMVDALKTALAVVNKIGSERPTSGKRLPNEATPIDPNASVAGLHIPDDRSGFSSPILDLSDPEARKNAQALEVLKIIRDLGYTLQKDPTHTVKQVEEVQPAVAAAPKNDKRFTCEICRNFTGRRCELRKHMKRHSKPYGCTFANCPKTFGSKNDWKRHENSQHFHQETLRCDIEKDEGGACGKAFYRRQTFQEHLKSFHRMDDEVAIKDKLESCRIGRNCQARFWCGFCLNIVELKKKGLDAWAERFDHIDDHFMGRDGRKEMNIRDWVYVNSDKRGDVDSPPSPDMDKDVDSSPEASGTTPATAIVVDAVEKSAAEKRKRDTDDDNPKPAKKRSFTRICCQCGSLNNPKLETQCNSCNNQHVFCGQCVAQYLPEQEL